MPIPDLNVTLNQTQYVTDISGQFKILNSDIVTGEYAMQIQKVTAQNFPLVVRMANDYKVNLTKHIDEPAANGGGTVTKYANVTIIGDVNLGTILSNSSTILEVNDSAFTVLSRVLTEKGIAFEFRGSQGSEYISSIAGLEEFDKGPNSGWEYYVNDIKPSITMLN